MKIVSAVALDCFIESAEAGINPTNKVHPEPSVEQAAINTNLEERAVSVETTE